jgi:hypothetical protein
LASDLIDRGFDARVSLFDLIKGKVFGVTHVAPVKKGAGLAYCRVPHPTTRE